MTNIDGKSKRRTRGQRMIPESLRPLARPIADLKPDPQNARLHNERNLNAIKASLNKFGQQKPIVALPDGTVIAGNGTLEAAKSLGWTMIAVNVFNGSAIEAKAYAIADNRTAELAEWDDLQLVETLEWLQQNDFPIDVTGFDEIPHADDFEPDLPPEVEPESEKKFTIVISFDGPEEQEKAFHELRAIYKKIKLG
jgi:ParB-like chromosome segregation protein Spo0J